MSKNNIKPFLLLILDGFGYREESESNAVLAAKMPNWQKYWQTYPHLLISGSGRCVGLPQNQMGNSEVGHLNLGAGRVIYQDLTRIDHDIETGEFNKNSTLLELIHAAKEKNRNIHLIGLVSKGGVHSHENHFLAMQNLIHKQGYLYHTFVHAFLDGRDTPPKSALESLKKLDNHLKEYQLGKIASIIGRFYAMDRDKRYDRVEKAYHLLTCAQADFRYNDVEQALLAAYQRGETDEFVQATVIAANEKETVKIQDDDLVIFMNFRADRARQLSYAFTKENFSDFNRKAFPKLYQFATLTEYATDLEATVLYSAEAIKNHLGEYLSSLGLTQLRIAETEKYAHVTFFFNGGKEQPYPNEKRMLIPSPQVKTYDLKPEMSAAKVTEEVVTAIESAQFDVIICNFANPDMVGHTGNFDATIKALETIDACLGKIISCLQAQGGEALITADHGNAECMFDPKTQQVHTAHTSEPVPLLYIGRTATLLQNTGQLSDVAPTLLHLMGLKIPDEMTGKILFDVCAHDLSKC